MEEVFFFFLMNNNFIKRKEQRNIDNDRGGQKIKEKREKEKTLSIVKDTRKPIPVEISP